MVILSLRLAQSLLKPLRWCILLCIAVNQGPILSSTIIPPSSGVEDLDVPGWVKSSAKMLNGGVEGQDWLALAKKLGESHSIDSLRCSPWEIFHFTLDSNCKILADLNIEIRIFLYVLISTEFFMCS